MKNKNRILIYFNVFLFLLSPNLFAEPLPGAFSLRLADGYIFFAQKREIKNTSTPTVELGYEFNEKWGMKIGATAINTDLKNDLTRSGVHGFIYTLNGVYKFENFRYIEPYALAGVGIDSLKRHDNSSDPNDEANINAGIGAQFFIDPVIALNAEAKDLYTMSGGKNDVMLTAGITFYFGGEHPPAPTTYKV